MLTTTHALPTEVAAKADFSDIRYAQCWEDADILLEALNIQPGDICLSIASAGDNTLAMLAKAPGRVIAIDLNPAQLACLELRVAAYRTLNHPELLELIGSRPSDQRLVLYQRCRSLLTPPVRAFWDARPASIVAGIGHGGKFERYFATFRRYMLPLINPQERVWGLLQPKTELQRRIYYEQQWNNWRWQVMFRLFFSRMVIGHLGRDPRFFDYVEDNVAPRILTRTQYALTVLEPAENPYLQWIVAGRHLTALPYALRPENFERIRANLDRLEWRCQSLESFAGENDGSRIDRYNLSDVFEYMAPERYYALLGQLVTRSRPGSRLVYWNMLAPRRRPHSLAHQLRPRRNLAQHLYRVDKAFFYSDFVVEEVI